MSIVSIKEGYKGHKAGGEVDSKTSVRYFSMVTSSPSDDARFTWPQSDPDDASIIIPAPGTFYPGAEDIRSKEPQVSKISPTFYNIEVQYAANVNSVGSPDEDDFASNPLSKPAEESWSGSFLSEIVASDINGVPYVNVFNEPVEDKENTFVDIVLTISRNEAAFNPGNVYQWSHSVYDGTFRGVPKGRVFMKEVRGMDIRDEVPDSSTFGEILYSKISYEIHIRWRQVPLVNAFFFYKTGKTWFWKSIDDTQSNQHFYAWFSRRRHESLHYREGNNKIAKGKEQQMTAVDTGLVKPQFEIPDYIFQQEYPFRSWDGVS